MNGVSETPNQIIISPCRDAWKNLALEEKLLEGLGAGERRLLLYRNDDCVVVGKNQNPWLECGLGEIRAIGVKLARRISGGGSVFHDAGNLNFSFLESRDCYCPDRHFRVILATARNLGIAAERTGHHSLRSGRGKFSGNAFGFRKSGALHHGTLLVSCDLDKLRRCLRPANFDISTHAVRSIPDEVVNLSDIVSGLTVQTVQDALIAAYREEFKVSVDSILNLEDFDASGLDQIRERHASWDWRFGRTPRFSWDISTGGAALRMDVEKGRIVQAALSFDAQSGHDRVEASKIQNELIGRRLAREDLKDWLLEREFHPPDMEQMSALLDEMNL
jgi:lipoate-protein ligase A